MIQGNKIAIIGAQYGDEGKGRIIDELAETSDIVVRFQGGSNAGHTVINQKGKFALSIVPSGIFNPNTLNIIASGTVVSPEDFEKETKNLEEKGISTSNLKISERAIIVMPYHLVQDELEEELKGENKVGTTKKGVGPAYTDKVARLGIRFCDIEDPNLREKLNFIAKIKNPLFKTYNKKEIDPEQTYNYLKQLKDRLKNRFINSEHELRKSKDKKILFEGQLGVMRSLETGIYPFVTSSNTITSTIGSTEGNDIAKLDQVLGVVKAYTSAVGTGPVPVEYNEEIADPIRRATGEYGVVTGRPRRIGPLDLFALKFAAKTSGMTGLILTHLDSIEHFTKLEICTGYELDGQKLDHFPSTHKLNKVKPILEEMQPWKLDNPKSFNELPQAAKDYITKIEQFVGVPIKMITYGPQRSQTVYKP